MPQAQCFCTRAKPWLGATESIIHDYLSRVSDLQPRHSRWPLGVVTGTLVGLLVGYLHGRRQDALRTMARIGGKTEAAATAGASVFAPDHSAAHAASLAALATHLQQQQENERSQLARELHDELGSLLTAAKLDVARLKSRLGHGSDETALRIQHLTDTLNSGIALKRRIIEDLRPSSLSNLGLVAAIEILAREFSDRSGVTVDTDLERVTLPELAQLTVYRLVQEALSNIDRHAAADMVSITIQEFPQRTVITVRDDGRGFDSQLPHGATHGLLAMRHRVESAGGQLNVRSKPDAGTTISATLPKQSAK